MGADQLGPVDHDRDDGRSVARSNLPGVELRYPIPVRLQPAPHVLLDVGGRYDLEQDGPGGITIGRLARSPHRQLILVVPFAKR